MTSDAVTYCNVCSAEIPEEEPTNEFSTPLLVKKGHCHSECLAQRNAILTEYESTVRRLSSMLNPAAGNITKMHQSVAVEQRRERSLKRTTERAIKLEPRPKLARRARKKKVKRGA